MAHQENSVLFSLRELRTLESDRVRGEEEAEEARHLAARRAREAEVRRAEELEHARRAADQERERAIQRERERQALEGRLRLEEAERLAHIEATARVEQTRIEAEARARVNRKPAPLGAMAAGALALVLGAAGLIGYLVHTHNLELAHQQAVLHKQSEDARIALQARNDAEMRRLQREKDDLDQLLKKAKSDADRAVILNKLKENAVKRRHDGPRLPASATPGSSKPAGLQIDPDDVFGFDKLKLDK